MLEGANATFISLILLYLTAPGWPAAGKAYNPLGQANFFLSLRFSLFSDTYQPIMLLSLWQDFSYKRFNFLPNLAEEAVQL